MLIWKRRNQIDNSSRVESFMFLLDSLPDRYIVDVYVMDNLQIVKQKEHHKLQPQFKFDSVTVAKTQAEPVISKIKGVIEARHKDRNAL